MSSNITVALTPKYDSIWQKCSSLGHDMILTMNIRRIFPTMEFMISGLEQNKPYKMSIHMAFVDNYKYRFDNKTGQYTPSTSTERKAEPRVVWHPKGFQTGQEWMLEAVSFDHVRISGKKHSEADSENIVHLLSGHRYLPVLTIYENDMPIHSSRIQHMIFNTSRTYHTERIAKYKQSINKFSQGERKGGKRKSANQEISEPAKQSRISSFMVKDLIEKNVPSTPSIAPARLSNSVSSATPESPGLKSIKSTNATPPPAAHLQNFMASGAFAESVRSFLTPPITPGSHKAKGATTPSTPTSPPTSQSIGFHRIHGYDSPTNVNPVHSTLTASFPSLMAFPGLPMMPFPMMPMMVPLPYSNQLFNPLVNPLMVNMVPTQSITPPNDHTTPGAIEDITAETEEIDILN